MLTHLQPELDMYAHEVNRVYNPIWSCLSADKIDDGIDELTPVG